MKILIQIQHTRFGPSYGQGAQLKERSIITAQTSQIDLSLWPLMSKVEGIGAVSPSRPCARAPLVMGSAPSAE